jgi:hypothetical protein
MVLCIVFAIGCGTSKEYLKSDDLTYKAIAPFYIEYVKADPKLDDDTKAMRLRTVETWRLRIDKGE